MRIGRGHQRAGLEGNVSCLNLSHRISSSGDIFRMAVFARRSHVGVDRSHRLCKSRDRPGAGGFCRPANTRDVLGAPVNHQTTKSRHCGTKTYSIVAGYFTSESRATQFPSDVNVSFVSTSFSQSTCWYAGSYTLSASDRSIMDTSRASHPSSFVWSPSSSTSSPIRPPIR